MKDLLIELKNLAEKSTAPDSFKKNLLKEYLQILVLDFIYSNPSYNHLVFYGGSCLLQCFGLPRLSEDLDFIDLDRSVNLPSLASDLENHFAKDYGVKIKTGIQKFRLYLKFPVLRKLALARKSESDLLFLKIEIFNRADFLKNYRVEAIPLFKFNHSILIKTLDLPTLMATKIRAVFHRKWEKTDKTGKTLISVKGRDYFDLMWYLQKGVKPNLDSIENIKSTEELKVKLIKMTDEVDSKSIQLDLESFINNPAFIKDLSKNIKAILKKELSGLC